MNFRAASADRANAGQAQRTGCPTWWGCGSTTGGARTRESRRWSCRHAWRARAQLLAAALLQEGLSLGAASARHLNGATARRACGVNWRRCDPGHRPEPESATVAGVGALALTKKGEWRKRLDGGGRDFRPRMRRSSGRGGEWLAQLAARRGLLELSDEIRELPDPQLSEDETQVLGVLARLLELAVAELDGGVRRTGPGRLSGHRARRRARRSAAWMIPRIWPCAWTAASVTSWSMSSRTPPWSRRACSRNSPRAGSREMVARCSWWEIRCSPSMAFARPRWACSSARARRASAP